MPSITIEDFIFLGPWREEMEIYELFYWVGLIFMVLGFGSLAIMQIRKVSKYGIEFFLQKLDHFDKKILRFSALSFLGCIIFFVIGAIIK